MEADDDEGLMAALLAASRVLVAMSARSLETSSAEVTLNQYRALVVLAGSSPTRMTDLSRELGLSPSSATRLVERLERKDLVRRSMNEHSRRSIDVHLQPAGEALVARVMAERRRLFEDMLAGVSDRRRSVMRRGVEDLAAIAGESVDDVSDALLGRAPTRSPR